MYLYDVFTTYKPTLVETELSPVAASNVITINNFYCATVWCTRHQPNVTRAHNWSWLSTTPLLPSISVCVILCPHLYCFTYLAGTCG